MTDGQYYAILYIKPPLMPAFFATVMKLRSPFRRWGLLLGAMLFVSSIVGQTSGQIDARYRVRYLGLKEGLSSRDVKDVYQDHRGVFWIATANGLNRYDGRQIIIYSNLEGSTVRLPSSDIRSVAEDKAHNLLLCTDAGLVALDPSRRRLISVLPLGFPDSVAQQTNCMMERLPDGRLFLLFGSVVYSYNQGKLSVWFRLPEGYAPTIRSMCYSKKDSTLYLKTSSLDLGLLAIRNNRLESLNFLIYKDGDTSNPPAVFNKQSYSILNCLGDSMTLFWNTAVGLRLQINHEKKQFERKGDETFSDVFLPWGAVQRYLSKMDESTLPHSMRGVNLRLSVKDNRGVYWLGTNIGVFMIRETRKSVFRQLDFLQNTSVRSILEDGAGNLLVGTYDGLFKYDPAGNHVHKMPDIKTVLDIMPVGRDSFWMSLERFNGLSLFDNKNNRLCPPPTLAPTISFAADFARSDSAVWIAPALEQLYCLQVPDGRILQKSALLPYGQPRRETVVKALLQAKNGWLWLATEEGLYRVIPRPNRVVVPDTSSIPSMLRGLKINALYEDRKGQLWLGTDGEGLAVLTVDSGKLTWYTTNDGLAHNVVFSILGSHHDSLLWIGTQNGLSCLRPGRGVFNNYYQEDGLADNEFNTGARYQAKDGDLYFGGVNGITYFNPSKLNFSIPPIRASLTIDLPGKGRGNGPAEWFPAENETVEIPASETYLEIRFFSNEVFDAEKVKYRYIISGLYEDWQYSDAFSKLILRNLAPGPYKLRVQALTPAGRWGMPFRITINKLPHYYQTWAFRGFMAVLVIALLYGLYWLRIWQIHQEYNMRSRIVNDLHDDLGSRLYALRAMATKITSPQTEKADLNALLDQFNAISKNAYGAMRDFIWAFDPKNDRLPNLVDRMIDFAENTIRPLVKELNINENISSLEATIAPVAKHHALMIFQEVLTNAAKHTVSESLNIEFGENKHQLCIRIINRHEGQRDGNVSKEHIGRESMDARIQTIKGKLEWFEEANLQKISIWMPF